MRAYSLTILRGLYCLFLTVAGGCVSSGANPPGTNAPCKTDDGCPAGYQCLPATTGVAGLFCCKDKNSCGPSGSGGSGGPGWDGPSSKGGSAGSNGGTVTDANPNGTGGLEDASNNGETSADVPIIDPATCASDGECSTGHCVDGVCCDGTCDGQCESCKEAGFVGTCKAIKGSPLAPRATCSGTGICKGLCDGSNGKNCTFPDSTAVCTPATCVAGKVTTASVCNSAGACSTPASTTCADSQCAADGSAKCASSCTASSCGAGFYCDSTGACLSSQPNGTNCSTGAQCTTGYCVDGVCCDSKCDGQCESCKETGTTGKCTPIKGAPLATRTACGGAGLCKGQCNGTNGKACTLPDSSVVCTPAACMNGQATTASVCNGSGACTAATSAPCASTLCATDGSGKCSGSCTATSCGAGMYCDSTGTCSKTLDNGSLCSNGTQCTSGNCVDGVCCDGKCDGQCQSCKEAGSVGRCKIVKGAPVSPRAACGGTGKCKAECDGANGNACVYPGDSAICSPASCSAGKLTSQSVCNGSGNCTASTTDSCPSNLCAADATSCAGSCTSTSCGTGTYCGSGGACTPTLGPGKPCSGNAQCGTGFCVDGVCCESACSGQCQSCSQTPGTCKTVTLPRTSCGGLGPCGTMKCDGTHPACVYPGSEVSCPSTCSGDSTAILSSACNGAGACGTAQSSPCGAHQSCASTAGTVQCACKSDSVCTAAGPKCASSTTLAACAQDAQGCFYQASQTNCPNGLCSGTACCANAVGSTCLSATSLQTCTAVANGCPTCSTSSCTSCAGAAGSASCCTNTCTVGSAQCLSGTALQTCSAGTNGCTALSVSTCASGLVCERYGTASCADPSWNQWPIPNSQADVTAGAPNSENYTDNGDGTVTDNVTGLMWQKVADAAKYFWSDALAHCSTLNLGNHSDWRLPSAIELVSIVDLAAQPAINITYFPSTLSVFWSSSPSVRELSKAQFVDFNSGYTAVMDVSYPGVSVRCVR